MIQSLAGLVILVLAAPASAASVDFQRDVRPILADNCFQCHGPDEAARQAGLRLDTREGALGERRRGAAVVPEDLDASLLVTRITHPDERHRMPPQAKSNKVLSEEQIQTLIRWIEEGASWDQHWAFEPISRPAPPAIPSRNRPGALGDCGSARRSSR